MSRTAFFGRYWITFATCAAFSRPYSSYTHWMISSRRPESKSTSMSGSSVRVVARKRSKGRPYRIGSTAVMPSR